VAETTILLSRRSSWLNADEARVRFLVHASLLTAASSDSSLRHSTTSLCEEINVQAQQSAATSRVWQRSVVSSELAAKSFPWALYSRLRSLTNGAEAQGDHATGRW
jgi:hypothetical protein